MAERVAHYVVPGGAELRGFVPGGIRDFAATKQSCDEKLVQGVRFSREVETCWYTSVSFRDAAGEAYAFRVTGQRTPARFYLVPANEAAAALWQRATGRPFEASLLSPAQPYELWLA